MGRMWKEVAMAYLKIQFQHVGEKLRKATNSLPLEHESILEPPEYRVGVQSLDYNVH
jgi:hypothetical protein